MWVRPGPYPRVDHMKGASLQSYPQTLDLEGKACQGQKLYLIVKISKLRTKKFKVCTQEEGNFPSLY